MVSPHTEVLLSHKEKALIYSTTGRNLENMLRERSQTDIKGPYYYQVSEVTSTAQKKKSPFHKEMFSASRKEGTETQAKAPAACGARPLSPGSKRGAIGKAKHLQKIAVQGPLTQRKI